MIGATGWAEICWKWPGRLAGYVCYVKALRAPNLGLQQLFERDVSDDYAAFCHEVTNR